MKMKNDIYLDELIAEAKREFVQQVFAVMGEKDINQSELARACNMKPQQITMHLHHVHNSSLYTMCRIAGVLGYRVRISLERIEQEAGE